MSKPTHYSIAPGLLPGSYQLDITAPAQVVEIVIRADQKVLWVNVDGQCALRICQIPEGALALEDNSGEAEQPESEPFNMATMACFGSGQEPD